VHAGVKQTRGKFGLGAKMALIWSKMTTGLPFTISSATRWGRAGLTLLTLGQFEFCAG
jgi:DNA topoisomerase VI subunit B